MAMPLRNRGQMPTGRMPPEIDTGPASERLTPQINLSFFETNMG
jgi:hypothetical protein